MVYTGVLVKWVTATLQFIALILSAGVAGTAQNSVEYDPNDFHIRGFHTSYLLERDEAGVSHLSITETVRVHFYNSDTHRGFERAIPRKFQGIDLNLEVESVTDEKGSAITVKKYKEGDFWVLRLGDADRYLTGEHTYVIKYWVSNVIRDYAETQTQELYWDVNGTGWAQNIGEVSMDLTLAPELSDSLTGKQFCYQGSYAASSQCEIEETEHGKFVAATYRDLSPFETMTIAIQFANETFTVKSTDSTMRLLIVAGWVPPTLLFLYSIVVFFVRAIQLRHAPGRGTIIPRYTPPQELDLVTLVPLFGEKAKAKAVPAQIIKLAVDKNVRILQKDGDEPGGDSGFIIENTATEDTFNHLTSTEQKLFKSLFGDLGNSENTEFSRRNFSLGKKIENFNERLPDLALAAGLAEEHEPRVPKFITGVVILLGVLQVLAFFPLLFILDRMPRSYALASVLALVLTFVALASLEKKLVRTALGTEVYEHVQGLRLYMSLAEADRLRVLQSPSASLTKVVGDDEASREEIFHLHEKLLPYAILFGMEKEWTKQLRIESEEYVAADTTDTINRFAILSTQQSFRPRHEKRDSSSTGKSSWGGSQHSSGSSGSSGGGYAGGGGGGGGGRGW